MGRLEEERQPVGNSRTAPRGDPESNLSQIPGNDDKVTDLEEGGRLEGVQPISVSVEHSEGQPPA
jgi:hypothetical protein